MSRNPYRGTAKFLFKFGFQNIHFDDTHTSAEAPDGTEVHFDCDGWFLEGDCSTEDAVLALVGA